MRFHLRQAGAVALLALLIGPAALLAQDSAVNVAGSGVVAPLFTALAENAGVGADVNVQVTGTNAGFQALCSGSAAVNLATRAITVEEEAACTQGGVEYVELLVGHNIAAFITSADSQLPQCVTTADLSAALAPSAQGQMQNWSQVNAAFPDAPLAVFGPAVDTAIYALADSLIEGVGLRDDLQSADSVVEAVAANAGALGVVSLNDALAAGESVRILQIDSQDGTGCTTPSADSVENRTYNAADRLLAYAAANSLGTAPLAAIFDTLTGEEGPAVIEAAGFTPATASAYAADRAAIDNGTTGRQFSQDVTDFQITDQLAGAITIGGSPTLVQYFQDLTAEFTAQYPAVTTEISFLGSTNGFSRLCAGTLDIAVADETPTAEQLAECDTNSVAIETIALGSEAAVLVSSADSEFLSCLSTEDLSTVWQPSEETVSTWNQVNADFPDAPVYLFAPDEGTSSSEDLMMVQLTGSALPVRVDVTERNSDVLYRAAAVANAGSGLTIMSWPEYQTVVNSGQAGIQLVSIDAGEGCVEPSTATIADGSYVLARPVSLLVSQSALARPEIQALLWTTLSDENYGLLQLADLVGIEFGDLPAARSALQAQFDAALIVASETTAPDASATEEAPAEAEAEPTAEATATS